MGGWDNRKLIGTDFGKLGCGVTQNVNIHINIPPLGFPETVKTVLNKSTSTIYLDK